MTHRKGMSSLGLAGLGVAVLLATHCANNGSGGSDMADMAAADQGVSVPDGSTNDAGGAAKPNIIFVLTDDLAWNLVKYMPHVVQMQQQGTTFSHYYVTDSLCCPSRSSIFTGKYPHDTTVFTNMPPNGGYAQYERAGNAPQTFAVALHDAGYRTGMMGKFLNGYDPSTNQADTGWVEWAVAGDGYPEYNYDLNHDGTTKPYGNTSADYLVDVLSGFANSFVSKGVDGRPFMLEVATFAPHSPYTPAPRYLNTRNEKAPRTAAFNTANQNPPQWLAQHTPLDAQQIANVDTDFNLRVEAVQAVDDLIAALMTTLQQTGLDKNTYIVFSSDNGYHMGEHMLLPGKQTAFDSDINVPLIIVGPGVAAGATVTNIAQNIDLCPTFAELAGTPAPPTINGHSLVALLSGQPVSDWRSVALIEHKGPAVVWPDLGGVDLLPPGDPDNEPSTGPIPNSYEAIRMSDSVYVEYGDGETEYYDLTKDPDERNNTVAMLSAAQTKSFHKTLTAIKGCHNSMDCWAAQKLQP